WEVSRDHLTGSDQVYTIHGVDPKSFQGKVEEFTRLIHPDDRARIDQSIQSALAGETAYDVEFRIIRPDGEVRWVLTSGQVVRSGGKPQRMLGATIDTTERKRAEETFRFLADASDTLSALVDYNSTMQKVARQSVPFFCDFCIVYMVAEGGEIERVASAHFNAEKERILDELHARFPVTWESSSPVIDSLRTGDSQFIEDVTSELLSGTVVQPERMDLIRNLGPKSVICVPLVVRDVRLGCLLLGTSESGRRYRTEDLRVAHDLARRAATAVDNARLYREVKQSARQKDDFIAMLAHELRNPLAAIHYANELTKMPGAMPQEEISDIIARQTNSLMRLIDDLLDISRITRDKIQLKMEYVDVATIVRRAVDTTRPLIEERKHKLVVEVEQVAMSVVADVMRLEQILVNLLSNAAKYTPDGGNIKLSARREDAQVVFRIKDSGIGIEKKMLSDVFDLFMQVGGSLDRAQGGLGLGLTIVRRLVELHHGTVSAASDGPGTGSEFIVRLPLVDAKAVAAPAAQPVTAKKSLKILVVDDNSELARSIGLLLTNTGHQVRIANDATTAIPLAAELQPDAFLLDIGLPGMNGYELARHLRQDFPNALFIAISGYGQAEDRERSQEAGFDYHLVKPVQQQDLQSLLEKTTQYRKPS
ncbi:MAG: ATP-binding protein, partial [Planctomycetaceae bacterium]